MQKLSSVAAAALLASATDRPSTGEAIAPKIEATPAQKLSREEFEASMRSLFDQQQIATHLEGWFRHALTYLVQDHGMPQAEAEPLAMKLAEDHCKVREWEYWPLPDEVVAKHMRERSP